MSINLETPLCDGRDCHVVLSSSPLATARHLGHVTKAIIKHDRRASGGLQGAFVSMRRHCIERGITTLVMDTRSGTRAARLWQIHGWVKCGELPNYACEDGTMFGGDYMYVEVKNIGRRRRIHDDGVGP